MFILVFQAFSRGGVNFSPQGCGIVLGPRFSKWDISYLSEGQILPLIFNRRSFAPLTVFVGMCSYCYLTDNWNFYHSPFVGRMQVLLMPNGKNWFYSLHGIEKEDLRLNSSFHLFLVTCFAKVCLLCHNRSDYWKPGRETIFYLWRQLRTWSCQDNKNVYHNNRTKASGKTALSSVSLLPCSSIS